MTLPLASAVRIAASFVASILATDWPAVLSSDKARPGRCPTAPWSMLPEAVKPPTGKLCVAHSVLNVPMPEAVLKRAGVLPLVRKLEPASVAQHVRVNRERQRACLADPRQCLTKAGRRHRRVTLGLKYMSPLRLLAPHPPQGAQFFAAERMNGRNAALQPCHVQELLAEIHLIPGERDQLPDTQPVSVRHQDHCRVAMAVTAPVFRRGDQRLDFGWRQILARSTLAVTLAARWPRRLAHDPQCWVLPRNCPVLSAWHDLFLFRRSQDFRGSLECDCRVCGPKWDTSYAGASEIVLNERLRKSRLATKGSHVASPAIRAAGHWFARAPSDPP